MSFASDYLENARKPAASLGGKLMLAGMNFGHKPLYNWVLRELPLGRNDVFLDVGCGGGKLIKMLLRCTEGRAIGIDYSPQSVAKTRRVNKRAIAEGRLRIREADIGDLPFKSEVFDAVTAVETIYFWPDIERGLSQVFRVLKPGGHFIIANEEHNPERAEIWSKRISMMNVYGPEEIESMLIKAGFQDVNVQIHPNGFYLLALARKPEPHKPAPHKPQQG